MTLSGVCGAPLGLTGELVEWPLVPLTTAEELKLRLGVDRGEARGARG